MRTIGFAALLACQVCLAQSSQPPATPQEVQYLRFMLLNVASLDHDARAIADYEDSLVKLHGLSPQDSAAIHSAGQSLHALLAQQRQTRQTILSSNRILIASDVAALRRLDKDRERTIVDLANQVLNSVSPQTAAQLRAPGRILSNVRRMP